MPDPSLPSKDRFPARDKTAAGAANKPGGQTGHIGTTLKKIADPDEIEVLNVDRSTLPPGAYQAIGYESRQVFDIDIRRVVTEYRAVILQDQHAQRYTAAFPAHVTKAVQYGNGVKAQSVYLSQYQLIPYQRVQEQFQDQLQLPISAGSVFAFNQQAYALLEQFEQKLIAKLLHTRVLHSDETGINIDGRPSRFATGWQTINLPSEDIDYRGELSGGAFTPNTPGVYLVNAQVTSEGASSTNDRRLLVGIAKNGTLVKAASTITAGSKDVSVGVTALVAMNGSTDSITLQAYSSGATVYLSGEPTVTFLQVTKVS